MKVIVIGAGVGGLVAAELFGKAGNEVIVFEKGGKDGWTYDWHDDVSRDIFAELGITIPKSEYFIKESWTFVTPDEKTELYVETPEETRDCSIERRGLAHILAERAQKVADIRFGTGAEALIIENDKVKGVIAGGEKHYADLVIDNSGVHSPFRASLPASYGVEREPDRNEVFYAYRGFHKRAEGSPDPRYTNKVYLKHLGEEGISWCILDPSGLVNILVGRIGSLPEATFRNAYQKLKGSNPIIGDEVVRGGGVYAIPVRHPAMRFGGDGYALIGDSAFMTIPMMGSGIANSMLAASLLAEAVAKSGKADAETIWNYQVAYYKRVGAKHTGGDVMKRWMLTAKPEELDFLIGKGVINKNDMQSGSTGNDIALSFSAIMDKVKRAFPRIPLLLTLKGAVDNSKKAKKVASQIPENYDSDAIKAWENKVLAFFKK
jgi:flavin-dependent dehydrogenase